MRNKKTRRSKGFFVLDIFEDLYFPEIFCDVIDILYVTLSLLDYLGWEIAAISL